MGNDRERIEKKRERLGRKKDQKEKAKRGRLIAALCAVAVGVACVVGYVVYATRPLDRIQSYEVAVSPQPDGALRITYHLRWEVLDSSREGPLEWVKIGMANASYQLVEYGGDIADKHIGWAEPAAGSFACFDLTRAFQKGETANFWFTVLQNQILCTDPDDPERLLYDFTPGWFPDIAVERYTFRWEDDGHILDHNADRRENGELVWEGSFKKGESRQMRLNVASDTVDPLILYSLPSWRPYTTGGYDGGNSGVDGQLVILMLMVTGIVGLCIWRGGNGYNGGRGFYGHHHGIGGGGGGCACACAGCACACACAGGGRAGCSVKEFYRRPNP